MSFRKIIRIFDFSSLASDSPNYEARTLNIQPQIVVVPFQSVDEILNDQNSDERNRAVLSCGVFPGVFITSVTSTFGVCGAVWRCKHLHPFTKVLRGLAHFTFPSNPSPPPLQSWVSLGMNCPLNNQHW